MSQHFLLSAQARPLSLRKIYSLSEDQAFDMFKQSCWGHHDATCPCCGSVAKHYFVKTRCQWRCRDCNHTFSVTSGTIFASHKPIYCNAVKGLSALQLARDLDVQYKTAFVLAHKIRESLMAQRDETDLDCEVELGGAYVNGHVETRPETT